MKAKTTKEVSETARQWALKMWLHCVDGQKNFDQEKAAELIQIIIDAARRKE